MKNKLLEQQKVSLADLGLMITLSILPLIRSGFDHPIIYGTLLLLSSITLLIIIREKSNIIVNNSSPLVWYFFFLVWSGITIFWSINPHRTLVEFVELSVYLLVFFLAARLNHDNLFRVGRIFLITGAGIAALGICQYLFLSTGRIQATFVNTNPLGIYLVMLFCFAWGYYLRRSNLWFAGTAVVLLTALILTGSRGSIISLAAASFFLFIGFKDKKLFNAAVKTVLGVAAALIFAKGIMIAAPYLQGNAAAEKLLTQSVVRISSLSSLPDSVVGRLAFWNVGWRLFTSEPVTGYGLGTYQLAYLIEYGGNKWYSMFAHNHYLQTLVESGLIGLFLLVSFIYCCGKAAVGQIRRNNYLIYFPGALAGMTAFLIHIGIDFSWNFPGATVIFFALAGIAVGNYKCENKGAALHYKYAAVMLVFILLLTGWQYSAEYFQRQGLNFACQGNLVEANHFYERANLLYPINAKTYSLNSHNYLQMYQADESPEYMEQALFSAQRAVELSPYDGSLHNRLGKLYWNLGDEAEAEEHLILGARYGCYLTRRYLDLGRFYFYQERYEEAETVLLQGLELLDIAISKAPGYEREIIISQAVDLHLFLATIYSSRDEMEQVRFQMESARELDKEHPVVKQYFELDGGEAVEE